jgi:O-antigen ligase
MLLDAIRRVLIFLAGAVLPMEHLNVGVGEMGGVLTMNKVVIGLLLVYAAAHWATRGTPSPRNAKTGWILFFYVSIGVSGILGVLRHVELRPLVGFAITWASLLLFYWVVVYVTTSRRDLDLLIMGLAIGIGAVVLSTAVGAGNAYQTRFGTRTGGYGGASTMLAFNAVISIPMFIARIVSPNGSRGWFSRAVFFGAIGVALVGIVVSLTRAAGLAIGAMGALWLYRTRRFQYALPMLLVLVVFLVVVPEGWYERMGTISTQPDDPSARQRLESLPQIAHAIASSPFVGLGLLVYRQWTYEQGYEIHTSVHNSFLAVLTEQGFLGFIPFAVIHFITWRDFGRCWRTAQRLRARGDPELLALGWRAMLLQISFAGAIVMGVFGPTHPHKGLWLLFALSTILVQVTRRRVEELVGRAEDVVAAERPAEPIGAIPVGATSFRR